MRGGRRLRHCPPILTPAQVLKAKQLRDQKFLIKQIAFELHVHRATVWRALKGCGSYKGMPGSKP